MKYTENYRLPLWEESDRVMRTDFNQMCADIDAGLARAQTVADSADTAYATGSYTGNGKSIRVDLNFRPSVVLVGEIHGSTTYSDKFISHMTIYTSKITGPVFIDDHGFTVEKGHHEYPHVNRDKESYCYIALR